MIDSVTAFTKNGEPIVVKGFGLEQDGNFYKYIQVTSGSIKKEFYKPAKVSTVGFTLNNETYYLNFKPVEEGTGIILVEEEYKKLTKKRNQVGVTYNFDLAPSTSASPQNLVAFGAAATANLTNYKVYQLDPNDYSANLTIDSNTVSLSERVYIKKNGPQGEPVANFDINDSAILIVQPGKSNSEPTKQTLFKFENGSISNGFSKIGVYALLPPPLSPIPKQQQQEKRPLTLANNPNETPSVGSANPKTLVNSTSDSENQSKVVAYLPGKKNPTDSPSKPENKPPSFIPTGVGGELKFKIGVPNATKDNFSDAAGYKPVSIELAPARQSFFDKQGQRVPGAGGGLEFRSRANLVKLNVPGSRPIYQHMGIAEETIEWVGAFVGFDHPDPTDELENAEHGKRTEDAWTSSNGILLEMRKGRELMIELSWIDTASKQEHSVKFSNSIFYRGFIKDLKRTYATSQRVYYSVCFCITNREDLEETAGTDDGVPAALPSSNSMTANLASEAAKAEAANAEAAAATNEFNGSVDPLKNMFNTFSANIEKNANDSTSPIPALLKELQSFFRDGFEYTDDSNKNLEKAKNGLKFIFEEIQTKHGTIFNRLKNPPDLDWVKLTLDLKAPESKDDRYSRKAIESLNGILVSLHEKYFSNILVNNYKEKDKYNFAFENVKSTFTKFLELQKNISKPTRLPGATYPSF